MTETERIDQLREELHRHNHNYYILNAPVISDQEFDKLMRELQDLEARHPEHFDPTSPSMRVGSDINKDFVQVEHKYPMLSLGNIRVVMELIMSYLDVPLKDKTPRQQELERRLREEIFIDWAGM